MRVAFLYIGTIIGAGFSSGREIALYFKGLAPYNAAIAALFIGAFALMFLTAGRLGLIPNGRIIKFLIFFSSGVSLTAMLAGGEYIMWTMTTIPLLGLIMAILSAIVVSQGIEKIKIANVILVPLIVLSIAIIFIRIPHYSGYQSFSITRPLIYSGLDILLGGVIIGEEGKSMTCKATILTSAIIVAFLSLMLYMLQTIVLYDTNGSLMPVFAISKSIGLQAICGVLIGGAIFTTLVSSLKISSDYLIYMCSKSPKLAPLTSAENKSIIVMFCLLIAYPISFFGFDNIVDNLYPVNSILGILLAAVVLVKIIVYIAISHKKKTAFSLRKPQSSKTKFVSSSSKINPHRRPS